MHGSPMAQQGVSDNAATWVDNGIGKWLTSGADRCGWRGLLRYLGIVHNLKADGKAKEGKEWDCHLIEL